MAAAKFILLSVLGTALLQCDAVRRFAQESEPEDLLLDQLASYLRHQNHQPPPPTTEGPGDETSRTGKKFAYRPEDPQFQKTWPPRAPLRQSSFWRPAQQQSRSMSGQKEDIDFLNNAATTRTSSVTQERVPHSLETQVPVITSAEIKDASDVGESFQLSDDDKSLEKLRLDGPVAHAIISHDGRERKNDDSLKDIYFTALVAGCTAAIVTITIGFGVCIYRWQKSRKLAQEVEYPAYGITGPGPLQTSGSIKKSGSGGMKATSPKKAGHGDKKLAHSAHMFHFQHQKQQVIAMENNSIERGGSNSGAESDEDDNEEGDYTVYECPGLAPTGEMEVKNPLFPDDVTPMKTEPQHP